MALVSRHISANDAELLYERETNRQPCSVVQLNEVRRQISTPDTGYFMHAIGRVSGSQSKRRHA